MSTLRKLEWADGSIDGGGDSFDSVAVDNGDLSVGSGSSGLATDGADSGAYIDLTTATDHLNDLLAGKFGLLFGMKPTADANASRYISAETANLMYFVDRSSAGELRFYWDAAAGSFSMKFEDVEDELMHLFSVSIDDEAGSAYGTVDSGNITGQSGHEQSDGWTSPLDDISSTTIRLGAAADDAGSKAAGTFAFFFILDLSTADPTINAAWDKALSVAANDAARANSWDADAVWTAIHGINSDITCVCWKLDETISGSTAIARYVSSGATLALDTASGGTADGDNGVSNADIDSPALNGESIGLRVRIDDTNEASGEIDLSGEASIATRDIFQATAWLDPKTLTMASGDKFQWMATNDSGNNDTGSIRLEHDGSNYQLVANVDEDDGTVNSTLAATITDAEHEIVYRIQRASSATASDGRVTLFSDGVQIGEKTGLDIFDDWAGDRDAIKFGVIAGVDAGTGGALEEINIGFITIDAFALFSNDLYDSGYNALYESGNNDLYASGINDLYDNNYNDAYDQVR